MMGSSWILTFLGFCTLSTLSVPVTSCPGGWREFGGNCYFRTTEGKTWQEGREECHSHGGELASIMSRAEQDFISTSYYGSPSQGDAAWIGLTWTEEGKEKWMDGSPVTWTIWKNGYPSNDNGYRNGECGALYHYDDGTGAANQRCSDKMTSICKWHACPEGWTRFLSKCYYRNRSTKTWQQAREECQSHGGDLVSIQSSEEQAFVHGMHSPQYGLFSGMDVSWIGLKKTEGNWMWLDGSPATFWTSGEPLDHEHRDCAYHRHHTTESDSGAATMLCYVENAYICEK